MWTLAAPLVPHDSAWGSLSPSELGSELCRVICYLQLTREVGWEGNSCLWLCSLCLCGTWFLLPPNIILGSDLLKGEPVVPGTVSVRALHPQLRDHASAPGSSKLQFPFLKTTPQSCLKEVWWDVSVTSQRGSIWTMCSGSPSPPSSALGIGPGCRAPASGSLPSTPFPISL